jgi:S-adenosylmethionine/arginine decarboxylase-like enzyme
MKGDPHANCHTDADMLRAGLDMYDCGHRVATSFALQLVASGLSLEQQQSVLEHSLNEKRRGDPDR